MPYNPNKHHRRSIRLKDYDYSLEGAYFITICCANRTCLFGKIQDNEMILNEYGTIAYHEWTNTSKLRKNVELDVFVIMPNHLHGIIILNTIPGRGELHSPKNKLHSPENKWHSPNRDQDENKNKLHSPENKLHSPNRNLPNIGGVFDTPLRSPSNNIGAIIRGYKSSVTKQLNALNIGCAVWQRNYYEHIIRNEQSYQRISEYIIDNPQKWSDDRFHDQ
ncbi:MAG TPA: transposase [Arenibacter sp.]|nr:transposase [Arenibacter sp.]